MKQRRLKNKSKKTKFNIPIAELIPEQNSYDEIVLELKCNISITRYQCLQIKYYILLFITFMMSLTILLIWINSVNELPEVDNMYYECDDFTHMG